MKSREAMPTVAAWIDLLRQAFGEAEINEQLRRGVRGEPVFFAAEGGHAIGTPLPPAVGAIRVDAAGNRYAEDYASGQGGSDLKIGPGKTGEHQTREK
ncbi:hypothetical protein [Herbaspirillum sp. 1130]|uniref:hypothetical protein n=1 Tax=Herbaspirillum sp. 1130 TaxID=2806562 RepID=UPI001AE6358D|nr:hypothetical protein [Herbaspirillum sp. 1130]MBP1314453.1 hypothetical protein [Herbaspirillum sp. 1130]